MKLYCLRHTRLDIAPGICYGQSDIGLADSYPEEKEDILKRLNGIEFDKIYSSPLKRCKTLAKDLFLDAKLIFDDRLKELNFGNWEMKSWDDISKTKEARIWFEDFVNIKCPKGESFNDQIERTKDFLSNLKKENNSSVLLVAHGGVIRAVNCLLNDIEPLDAFKTKVDYGELVSFDLK